MTTRERLPNRRAAEVVDFIHRNRRWTATIGHFSDGQIAGVFLHAERVDPVAEMARDSPIVASLALQFGCPLETLRHALAGHGGGPLSAALAAIEP